MELENEQNEPVTKKAKVSESEPLKTDSSQKHVMTEPDVGIRLFTSTSKGFSGILKQRYSDFIVNEIDLKGNVVELTDATSLPQLEPEPVAAPLAEVLSPEIYASFQEFLKNLETDPDASFDIENCDDKEYRTKIHSSVKLYPNLVSETFKGIITIKQKRAGRGFRDVRDAWPKGQGEYLQFVLYKENVDTTEAVSQLCKYLKLSPKTFAFAGTKDKRGATTQLFTAFKLKPERLVGLNNKMYGMRTGNYQFVKDHLRLGDLKGNRFTICIRHVDVETEQITVSAKALEKNGFINYYGMQRFGSTSSVPTFAIGIALLKEDYEKAVHLILDPREGESFRDAVDARQYYKETGDIPGTLKRLPKFLRIEKTVLMSLRDNGPRAFLNAILAVPRNMKTMYVHSYQSLVWNNMVNVRIQKYGLVPVEGDLVVTEINETENVEEDEANDDEELSNIDDVKEKTKGVKVKALTAEDIKSGNYTIDNVVLPIPGNEVVYPSNLREDYKEFLKKDGFDIDNMKHKQKVFNLAGGYRKMIERPNDLKWEILHYNDFQEPLVVTALARLTNKTSTGVVPDGKYRALKIEFSLPSSTYATMLFRELLKTDSSTLFQKSLTNEFLSKNKEEKQEEQ